MYNKSIFAVILQWIHTPALWRSDIDLTAVCMYIICMHCMGTCMEDFTVLFYNSPLGCVVKLSGGGSIQ